MDESKNYFHVDEEDDGLDLLLSYVNEIRATDIPKKNDDNSSKEKSSSVKSIGNINVASISEKKINVETIKKFSVYIPEHIIKDIKHYCIDHNVRISDYLSSIIDNILTSNEPYVKDNINTDKSTNKKLKLSIQRDKWISLKIFAIQNSASVSDVILFYLLSEFK